MGQVCGMLRTGLHSLLKRHCWFWALAAAYRLG